MRTSEDLMKWLDQRIDYYETLREKAQEDDTADEATLSAYYTVQEFLTGQRR